MRIYLFLLLVAAAVSFLTTPAARLLARRVGAMTAVRARDVHDAVTPRLGGLAMFAGVTTALVLASRVPFLQGLYADSAQPWGILAAAGMVCLLGAADDKWELDWGTKLAGQVLAALLLAASTITVTGQVDPARLTGADLFGQFLPILLPIAVMVVPFLDFALAVVRRIGSGRSPFHADKAHLHHRLLSLGHSKTTAVLIMYTWTVVISIGMLLPLVLDAQSVLLFWAVGVLIAVVLTFDPLDWRRARRRKENDVHVT